MPMRSATSARVQPSERAATEDSIQDVAAHPVFAMLPEHALRELAKRALDRKYAKGHFLYHAADPPAFLILVRSGLVGLTDTDDHGHMHPIQAYSQGDLFGIATSVLDMPRRFTAYALTDVETILIPQKVFGELYAQFPAMAYATVRLLGAMLCRAQETSCTLTLTPTAFRVARFLLQASEKGAGATRRPLAVTLSRNDLAIMVGTTRETVTRVLSRLSRERLITVTGRHILIKQPDDLRRFAEQDGQPGSHRSPRPATD
jgi:CRP/FNR family cyclic AMP-dependent transcriptional regulator